MKRNGILLTAFGCFGAMAIWAQAPAPAPAPQRGPGVQAPQDAGYQEWVMSKCKTPPPQRGGGRGPAPAAGAQGGQRADGRGAGDARGGGAGRGDAAAGPPAHRDYKVTAIPGVIAEGQTWKSIWTGTGNNADGIIASKSGGILAAQNTNSDILELDKNGKASVPYKGTNTGGAISMNKKGTMFVVSRGLPASVLRFDPKKQMFETFTNMFNGEPLDCIGGVINDLTADSKGGVYFTMGGLFYANPMGMVTRYGDNLATNGIILSPDEKTLYVTTRGLVAFDVQPDGSLKNQRQFAMVGGDGTTVDAAGRIYTTTNGEGGVAVLSPDGKLLGNIPTPLNFITVAFSGPDKKTLYGVANNQRFDEIFTIQMIAQGYKGRAK